MYEVIESDPSEQPRKVGEAVVPAAEAYPARNNDGMKWSGVGTAIA